MGDTTAVGSYPSGVSLFGILDMAGNVRESTWEDGTMRGGSFLEGELALRATDRQSDEFSKVQGFRCVRYEPPN